MSVRYLWITTVAALALIAPATLAAQSASEHVAVGDQLHAELKPADALTHYQAALAVDSTDYEALWKALREDSDLAEFEPDEAKRNDLYKQAEIFARRAIAAKPTDAEGHFYLARAIGKLALTMGKRDAVKFAGVVHDEAMLALQYNPKHAGALHVMGRWNAEIMRLSGFSRFMAKNFLGGKIFNQASWDNARKYMEEAVALDPTRLTHHLDLGEVYVDLDQKDKAKAEFEAVINGKELDYNDRHYKQQAAEALKKLS